MPMLLRGIIMDKLLANPEYAEKFVKAKTTFEMESVINDFCVNENVQVKVVPL